jgi:lipoate-protein ligase B
VSTVAPLAVRALGRTAYGDAHRLQLELLQRRIAGAIPDVLLLTEHDPVVTVGRGRGLGGAGGLAAPVVEVERGGEATWHGPGQLVGYPILELPEGRRDLHRYLRDLEQALIDTLAELGVSAARRAGLTGVWVGERKIASIGVAVRRWVTWHGFALNVDADLASFRAFRPCGLDPDVMTRLADHLGDVPTLEQVGARAAAHLARVLGFAGTAPWRD